MGISVTIETTSPPHLRGRKAKGLPFLPKSFSSPTDHSNPENPPGRFPTPVGLPGFMMAVHQASERGVHVVCVLCAYCIDDFAPRKCDGNNVFNSSRKTPQLVLKLEAARSNCPMSGPFFGALNEQMH